MKNLKKLVFGLVATITFSLKGNAQDINTLNVDKDFQSYILNEKSFLENATNLDMLEEIYADLELTENEMLKFYLAFGTSKADYEKFLSNQNVLFITISKKYNLPKYNKDELAQVLIPIIESIYSNNTISSKAKPCRDLKGFAFCYGVTLWGTATTSAAVPVAAVTWGLGTAYCYYSHCM